MIKESLRIKQPAKLQMRAEEFLNKKLSEIKKTSPRDVRNLFEDLQIYQTELESNCIYTIKDLREEVDISNLSHKNLLAKLMNCSIAQDVEEIWKGLKKISGRGSN